MAGRANFRGKMIDKTNKHPKKAEHDQIDPAPRWLHLSTFKQPPSGAITLVHIPALHISEWKQINSFHQSVKTNSWSFPCIGTPAAGGDITEEISVRKPEASAHFLRLLNIVRHLKSSVYLYVHRKSNWTLGTSLWSFGTRSTSSVILQYWHFRHLNDSAELAKKVHQRDSACCRKRS